MKKLLAWMMALTLGLMPVFAFAKVAPEFEPGTYTGAARGHNGTVEVEIEVSKNAIEDVKLSRSEETQQVAKYVYEKWLGKEGLIVKEQNLALDAVTGATVTSNAVKAAVIEAVKKAKADPKTLMKAPAEPKSDLIELTADVVVIGGGAAGMSVALKANQQGLSVILLEKNTMLGGHTTLSGGFTIVTGSEIQKTLGVTDDTPQKAYDDMMKNGGNKSVPELLDLYCHAMGEATDWTLAYVGAKAPEQLTPLSENGVDRAMIYVGGGPGLMDAYEAKAATTDIDIRREVRATTLLTEGKDVIGVEAKGKDGSTYQIHAKATVLATGSYGARKDLLPENLKNFIFYGAALASGDGLEMGQAVGADTVNMGMVELFENGVEWLPGIAKSTYNGSMAAWTGSGILVDRKGHRVVNERGPGISIVAQQSAQPDSTLFLFMDQATYDIFQGKIAGYGISLEMLDEWLANNGQKSPILVQGTTIEEAAEKVGIDAKALQETVERYNGFVKQGKDEDFDRPSNYMAAEIGEGPYYLIEQKPRYATTLGGLLINTKLEVISKDGEVIKGLYAVGDTAGGVRGNDSVPGADVGWAIASGYWAGKLLGETLNAR